MGETTIKDDNDNNNKNIIVKLSGEEAQKVINYFNNGGSDSGIRFSYDDADGTVTLLGYDS